MSVDEFLLKAVNLLDESDRGSVIVGAALLEDDLTDLLRRRFRENRMSKKHIDEMLSLSGPIASFSSKSLVCYGFGLISKSAFDDLAKIRRLRNKFAHTSVTVDFLDPEVEDIIADMQCCIQAAKNFEGSMFKGRKRNTSSESDGSRKLSDWKARSVGFVKYTKAVFCIGVSLLRIQIESHANDQKT